MEKLFLWSSESEIESEHVSSWRSGAIWPDARRECKAKRRLSLVWISAALGWGRMPPTNHSEQTIPLVVKVHKFQPFAFLDAFHLN